MAADNNAKDGKSIFEVLNGINCNEHTERKNGLTYLSWAWAWAEVKKAYPCATFTIYEWANSFGCPQNYFTDGRTAWVKTGVTIEGLEYIEELPVMDMRNRSIPVENVTSFDVNKAIQRSLTKACARHGLGLYIYAGEDLPEEEAEAAKKPAPKAQPKPSAPVDDATYWTLVKMQAAGQLTKQGVTPEEYLRDIKKAPAAYISQFRSHVEQLNNVKQA